MTGLDHLGGLPLAGGEDPAAATPAAPAANSDAEARVRVYDPAMCCSTGVCGPAVDQTLVRFSGDVQWLEQRGVAVRRFNLGQEPGAFLADDEVRGRLDAEGEDALPIVLVDGELVASGSYPDRQQLAEALGLEVHQ